MILADSIGFAATHTISEILSGIPNAEVRHGTRNFAKGGAVGGEDTPVDQFVAEMKQSAAAGKRVYAVHCLYSAPQGREVCLANGVKHRIIVREPVRHVRSCFAWWVKKTLGGDQVGYRKMVTLDEHLLSKLPIPRNFPNAAYAAALSHVMQFNIEALEAGCEILQMERLVSDEDYFRESFDVPDDVTLSHFSGAEVHRASHKDKLEGLGVGEANEDALRQVVRWTVAGKTTSFAEMSARLGYS